MDSSFSYSSSNIDIETPNLIGLLIVAYVVPVFSVLGGVNGGQIIIPLYSLILNKDVKDVVFYSLITICGGAIIKAVYFSIKRNNQVKNRYLTNYDLIRLTIIFNSMTSFLGYALNKVLPNIVVFIIMVLLMGVLIFKTIKNTIKIYKKKEEINDVFVVVYDNIESKIDLPTHTLDNDRKGETKFDLFKNIIFCVLIAGLGAFFTFVRNIYDDLSLEAWLIYIAQITISMIFAFQIINEIKMQYVLRKKTKFNFIEGDIKWTDNKNFLKYGIASGFVGIISSLVGIGGSVIMNPIMINLELLPEVVVATSSVSSFFSSLVATIQYIFDEKLEWVLLGLFFAGSFGALTGVLILRFLKKNLRVAITFFLTFSLIGSLILLIVTNIISFVEDGVQ